MTLKEAKEIVANKSGYNTYAEMLDKHIDQYGYISASQMERQVFNDAMKLKKLREEWLARQSRKNCHGFVSDHPKAQCTGEL